MQSVSSRIWTRAAVSISINDNHYTTGILICIIILLFYINFWVNLLKVFTKLVFGEHIVAVTLSGAYQLLGQLFHSLIPLW